MVIFSRDRYWACIGNWWYNRLSLYDNAERLLIPGDCVWFGVNFFSGAGGYGDVYEYKF